MSKPGRESLIAVHDELLRTLTPDEQSHRYIDCCWTSRDRPNCVRLPTFRLATPHGHMDFCPEHIGYAIASLPAEWLVGWEYREPLAVTTGENDDIPF